MEEKIQLLQEQITLLERQIRSIGGTANNNTSSIDEIIILIESLKEDTNEKLSTISNEITEIKTEITDVKKNIIDIEEIVNNLNDFIEGDVREEIESLKEFSEEIIA